MNTFLQSIRIGWEYLTHPYTTTDEFIHQHTSSQYSWIFLMFSLVLWTCVTGYQNVIVGETSRARDVKLGISFGPDILITLLTIPIGIFTVAAISLFVTQLLTVLGGHSTYHDTFKILAFTLNIGSTFFDLHYEIGATLTGHAWQLHEVPNFVYYTIFIMGMPLLWSFLITILALSHYTKLGILKTLIAFILGVFPLFALLIFIVM